MTRTPAKRRARQAMGARPVVADALDPDAVARVVGQAEPEVMVHQLTALSGEMDMRHVDRFFAATTRLRTEATDHLLAAGRAVGTKRFVAQSCRWLFWCCSRVSRQNTARARHGALGRRVHFPPGRRQRAAGRHGDRSRGADTTVKDLW